MTCTAPYEDLARGLPPALHRLLVDCEPPCSVSVSELALVLELLPPSRPAASLQSLRMLRMLRGLPPELEAESETPPFVLRRAGALAPGSTARLRAAVDEHLDASGRVQVEDTEIRAHMLGLSFSSQLVLDRAALEALVGIDAVAVLWRLPAEVAAGRAAAAAGQHSTAALSSAGGSTDGAAPPEFRGAVEISVRRYSPDARPWVPFHHDRATCTVNVALAPDSAHSGGTLLGFTKAEGAWSIGRSEGEVTAHGADLLHAVTRLKGGARYSLILFFGPRGGGEG